jgi:hypothetical protein
MCVRHLYTALSGLLLSSVFISFSLSLYSSPQESTYVSLGLDLNTSLHDAKLMGRNTSLQGDKINSGSAHLPTPNDQIKALIIENRTLCGARIYPPHTWTVSALGL